MTLPERHSLETKKLVKKVPKNIIAKWLLEQGYYPEQYVIPPTFKVVKFNLQPTPYFKVETSGLSPSFEPSKSDLITVSFPKTQLTDRTFGIIEPKIYHDLVWYLMRDWDLILKRLFRTNNKIHSYSFPLPVTTEQMGLLSDLRAGRMIYEFLEMAESDLVAEAYNYKYILKTDIKNFYPSIYTHSVAWAIHTKEVVRKKGNRSRFDVYVGLVLDKLLQASNDGCTNGIAIGPAITDLIAEILLAEIDTAASVTISSQNISFLGVRFKDDYRFLCHTRQEANIIIKILQQQLAKYNLMLNEKKCEIEELPEGLFREWTADYQPYSLRYKRKITYRMFETTIRATLLIDRKYDGTGVVDRFLSELYTKKHKLKFDFDEKDLNKAVSLLFMLKERRSKSLPQILGIIELMILQNKGKTRALSKIVGILNDLLMEKLAKIDENLYDLMWIIYFLRSQNLISIPFPKRIKSELINSLKNNRSEFFKPLPADIKLFETVKKVGKNEILLRHLAMFKKNED